MAGPTDLTAAVRAYLPYGDVSSHAVALGVLDTGRPMWPRSEFSPGHFTVSGFVASPDLVSMLLIHHDRLGRWLQPGGHIESDDATVEDTARREVGEETGITGLRRVGSSILRIDAHPIPPRGGEPVHTHIDLGIGFIAETDQIGPIAEVLDATWVRFDDLERFDTDDAVRRGATALRMQLD